MENQEYIKFKEDVGDLNAPIIFELREENKSTLCVRGWSTSDLVAFGNYVVSDYRTKLINQHPELTIADMEAAQVVVSDADLANWLFLRQQDNSSISETVPTDDRAVYPNKYFDNELEERAEQFRTGGI